MCWSLLDSFLGGVCCYDPRELEPMTFEELQQAQSSMLVAATILEVQLRRSTVAVVVWCQRSMELALEPAAIAMEKITDCEAETIAVARLQPPPPHCRCC